MSSTSMSLCKKFTPNIFNKIKCSNCFRQKEEHSAEALECNRACRSVARSGYLFVAPDWDFSVPLNRTKRWQRRWFVLYDDGELNYSVDEHPDTVPQGSVDMSQVLEVTGAEQVTGHPHSLALTSPDRVTFVKAASREDARWWAELLAVFPRRHKRNATFPGGRASPSLPQLGRSASPQPPRLRHLSCTGASPRTNFTTPPLKEEKETPSKDDCVTKVIEATVPLQITQIDNQRNEYCITSGSPPTRDKLRCEDKARVRRDWRNERLRDIATALTDRSPESSLALPAEGILNLKKGWLWYKDQNGEEWIRLWWVLCGPTLNAFKKEQDEQGTPEVSVELSTVTACFEIKTETRYGFQINWSGPTLILSAVTSGIRSNWLQALKRAAPNTENSGPTIPRATILSSDDEYRTASEGGRRDSEDWGDYHSRSLLNVILDKNRRPKLSRCHSRQSTTDSVSTDELDGFKDEMTYNQIDDLKKKLIAAKNDIQKYEMEIFRMKKVNLEASEREHKLKEILQSMEKTEKELILQVRQSEEKYLWEFKNLKQILTDSESNNRKMEEQCVNLTREVQSKHRVISSLQDEINCTNERLNQMRNDNDKLFKKLQDYEGKKRMMTSLTDLTNVDLDIDLETLNQNELMEQCLDLKGRFEKAVLEIRALKREIKESNIKYDKIELENIQLKRNIQIIETSSEDSAILMATRIEDLTSKLTTAEKQVRTLKSKLQDSREKRRSLSLKGRENLSINKEVEDKLVELETKVLSIEQSRVRRKPKKESSMEEKSLRRIRRKSLDSATSSEPIKLIMRLSTLENKITQVNTSEESLYNSSLQDLTKTDDFNVKHILQLAKEKLDECKSTLIQIRSKRRASSPSLDRLGLLEANLNDLNSILSFNFNQFSQPEVNVVNSSVQAVVMQLKNILYEKLKSIEDKKISLRNSNKLDESAKIQLFAEKIAFENIIIGRMNAAINLPQNESCDRLIGKESVETVNLIKTLQGKLLNGTNKDIQLITSVDHLSKILTQRLLNLGNNLNYPPENPINYTPHIIIQLKDEQNKLNNLMLKFKTEKLSVLAELLAIETLKLSNDDSCCITKDCIGKTWVKARELINSELISSEINHVLMKTAQKYESASCSDQGMFFTFYAFERAFLELWSESVENFLKSEMETYITELNELYENYLMQLKDHTLNSDANKCKELLEEFADVISHKALIDARIYVLKGECVEDNKMKKKSDTSFISEYYGLEEYWDCLQNINLVNKDNSAEEEFKLLLERNMQDAYGEVFYKMDFPNLCQAILAISDQINDLEIIFKEPSRISNNDIIDIKDICFKCSEMQTVLSDLRENILNLKKRSHSFDEDYKRPLYFGTEYSSQVENLRAAFRKAISVCENHKLQVDLEKLQNLCEQVLVSIEHWHRRSLHDLRETHSKELQALRDDKEQALAEETQATLAALDAMRKAHEAEVQREVARFKQDFIKQKENELTELQERLSIKCLEATALQEQLNSATRQLTNAQLHISKLEHSSAISTYRN